MTETAAIEPAATLDKRACPECGGDLQWNAAKRALVCPYCGTVAPWQPDAAAAGGIAELDLAQALAKADDGGRGYGDARREVQCQSCRAISVFEADKVADRCAFCGSPAIVPYAALKEAITPQSLLPFCIPEPQVRESIRRWYGSRWFAPNRLKRAALTDTLHGVYLPYWTFDAQVHAEWTAESGTHYYTTETYTQNGQTRTRQVQHTDWKPASGELDHFFDDDLVPGSEGAQRDLLEEIEPFPTTTDLKPYAPEFVRGWTVERYQVDLRQAAQLNMAEMESALRELCAQQVPGDTYRNLQVQSTYRGRTFKHVLVPVWLVSYTYGRRAFQVLVNGYTGTIAGRRPYSWIKIALAVTAALVVALVYFWLNGQD
ncbi:zinc ribbon domain-containing protein [Cognatilysobacter lacus]|uniref:Zinc ribbon domain-containing protein n=1 Tax=Cognatilysobacter lacus TaxID=1643323 RepID=A0A5D8Z3M1_9GAMM|nr:zinc ribbon domain-containing protein [Lysobacter lacus]TZF89257.1 zinc ribbon domain-containing protein [Lysobacter lacus]